MTIYRIAKWQAVFERAESRKLKLLTWISMPVSFTSYGYQSMLDEFEEDAAAVYGAWCALCAVAASCPVRGLLTNSKGQPLKVSHIARRTGFQSAVFEKLIGWASSVDVGWLELVDESEVARLLVENADFPSENSDSGESPDDAPKHQGNSPTTEHNRTEQDITKPCLAAASLGAAAFLKLADLEEVRIAANKLRSAWPAGDREFIWQVAYVATTINLGLCSDWAARIKAREVRKPQSYLTHALRKECEVFNLQWDTLRLQVPKAPPVKEPIEA